MPETYKKLHADWKAAKKNATTVYDAWARLLVDLTQAHIQVKTTAPSFPKFKLDLGPSLDKLESKKDVDKYTAKAEKAVKQYKKDIKDFQRSFSGMPEPEAPKSLQIHKAMGKYAGDLLDVLARIEKKMAE